MKEKFKMKAPDSMVLILTIVVIACLLTWIVPAGMYERITNTAGQKLVVPGSFKYVGRSGVNPLLIPYYIVQAFKRNISLLLTVLFGGAAFHFISITGALESIVAVSVKKLQNKSWIFVPLITILFVLLCTSRSLTAFIPFAPMLVVIALSLGYDEVVGVSFVLLGGAIGFSTGTLQQSTTMVAQELSGLVPFSGLWYRAICLVVFSIVSIAYLMRYAKMVKADPKKSVMYGIENRQVMNVNEDALEKFGPMTTTKWLSFATLVLTLGILVVGAMNWKWRMDQFSAGFLMIALDIGIIMRLHPNTFIKEFFTGMKSMVYVGTMICTGGAISLILTDGHIIDTIVHALSIIMTLVPHILQGPAMFYLNILINVFINSGSGQAVVVIPILTPIADMIGMTRQTMVLAYNFGDGFSNYVLPTVGSLMGILGMGNVPYDRWMKFMWKLFLIWVLTGSILLIIANEIHLA